MHMRLASIARQCIVKVQASKLFYKQVNSQSIQGVVRGGMQGCWEMQTSDLFPGESRTLANELH